MLLKMFIPVLVKRLMLRECRETNSRYFDPHSLKSLKLPQLCNDNQHHMAFCGFFWSLFTLGIQHAAQYLCNVIFFFLVSIFQRWFKVCRFQLVKSLCLPQEDACHRQTQIQHQNHLPKAISICSGAVFSNDC